MRAKFLKTRDSGGVGSYVDFKVDWSTLTFDPWNSENGGGAESFSSHVQSNMPNTNTSGGMQKTNKGKAKPSGSDLKRPSTGASSKSDEEEDGAPKKPRGIIKGLGGKKTLNKTVKLV